MAEILILDTPIVPPAVTEWAVRRFHVDAEAPAIKVEFQANTGERISWRYIVSDEVTLAQVRAGISFINQGRFMTVQGKSLEKWLIQQAQAAGILGAGSVSGTVS